jgi:hypothetical protein
VRALGVQPEQEGAGESVHPCQWSVTGRT